MVMCNKFRRTKMRNLKKLLTLCSFAFLFTLLFADASYAQVMNTATAKAVTIFNHVKIIIFVVGGFGLVGVAWGAIWGKINWKWFGALAVGLAVLSAAAAIVQYATGDTAPGFDDKFGQSTSY